MSCLKDPPCTFLTHFLYILKMFTGKTTNSSKLTQIHTIVRRMKPPSGSYLILPYLIPITACISWVANTFQFAQHFSIFKLQVLCPRTPLLPGNWDSRSSYTKQWHSYISVDSAQRCGYAQTLVLSGNLSVRLGFKSHSFHFLAI